MPNDKLRTNYCGNCNFFDAMTRDPNDISIPAHLDQVKRACRRYPAIEYKSPAEWCGEWTKA